MGRNPEPDAGIKMIHEIKSKFVNPPSILPNLDCLAPDWQPIDLIKPWKTSDISIGLHNGIYNRNQKISNNFRMEHVPDTWKKLIRN